MRSALSRTFAPVALAVLVLSPVAASLAIDGAPLLRAPDLAATDGPRAPGADADAAQAQGNTSGPTVAEGFSNVQLVWTSIGFGYPLSAAQADMDGDGDAELAIGTETAVVVMDRAAQSIVWESKIFARVKSVAFADVDGSMPLDVLAVAEDGGLYAFGGADGASLWTTRVEPLLDAFFTDLNGDAAPDLLMASFGGKAMAVDGKSGAALWTRSITDAAQFAVNRIEPRGLVAAGIGDLTGDGVPELLVGDSTHADTLSYSPTYSTVYAFNGDTGTLLWANPLRLEPAGYTTLRALAVGDLDGDGAADVVAGGEYENVQLKNVPRYCPNNTCVGSVMPPDAPRFYGGFVTGLRGMPSTVAAESGPPVAVTDTLWTFDVNDARVTAVGVAGSDAVAATTAGELIRIRGSSTVRGEGGAPLALAPSADMPAQVARIDALPGGDLMVRTDRALMRFDAGLGAPKTFDPPGEFTPTGFAVVGEGEEFLAAVTNARLYLLNGAMESVGAVKTLGKGSALAAGEFTGDSVPDLVLGATDGDVYLMNGRTGRRLASATTEGVIVPDVAVTKINTDGKPDVLVASRDGRAYGLDGATFQPLWTTSFETPARMARAADLTGDGTLDLVVLVEGGAVFAVDGRDGKQLWRQQPQDARVDAIAVGDFNGDGTADAAIGYGNDGQIAAVNGKTGANLWSAKGDQRVKALAAGDMTGDGKADLVALLDRPSGGGNPFIKGFSAGAPIWKIQLGEMGFIRSFGIAMQKMNPTSKGLDAAVCVSAEAFIEGRRATAALPPPVHQVYAIHGEQGHVFWQADLPETCHAVAIADLNQDGLGEALVSFKKSLVALNGKDGSPVLSYGTNGANLYVFGVTLNRDKVPEIVLASEDDNVYALAFQEGALFDAEQPTAQPTAGQDFFGPEKATKKKGFLPAFDVALVAAAVGAALVLVRRRRA